MQETASGDANPLVEIEQHQGFGVLRLNRPEKYNPLDNATLAALARALAAFEADKQVRVVIITGRGAAFSAGGDLEGYLEVYRKPEQMRAFLQRFFDVCTGIERSEKIVIAAINGYAVAGGLELLLACDVVLAADTARIGDGHINYAQLPGAGGSQRLPRAIGTLRAKSLMLSGELIAADAALAIGLVSRVVPAADLEAAAIDEAKRLLEKSPAVLAGMKHLVNQGMEMNLLPALQMEMDHTYRYATQHPDAMEGLFAFRDKRLPRFL